MDEPRQLEEPGRRPPGGALVTSLALAGLACGALAAWLAATSDRVDGAAVSAALAAAVGWSFVGSGLAVWRGRPENRLGPAMVATGFAWWASFLMGSESPLAFTAGTAVGDAFFVGFVYLLLSFPTGRLGGRLDALLFAGAVAVAVLAPPAYLLLGSEQVFCEDCPRNVMQVADLDETARLILDGQRLLAAVLALVAVAVLVSRWGRATLPRRRAAAPVLWAGSAMLAAVAVSSANDAFDTPLGDAPAWMLSATVVALPVAVLAVLARRRLARAAVAGLVVDLGEQAEPGDVRVPLARALGDPSLDLVYWVPTAGRYVDRGGTPRELPAPGEGRAATVVERGGLPIAAILHDPALSENAELVRSVASAAALAIENERLHADLQARLAELRASRTRLVEAGDRERRRIERNLHDGAQQRLVSVAMTLGLAHARARRQPDEVAALLEEARSALALAMDELRELSQGIHPGVLTERGLDAAVDELAGSAPLPVTVDGTVGRRLPEGVEGAAYFLVSESLANAAKHSHASSVRLAVALLGDRVVLRVEDDGIGGADPARGSGLRGLVDRIEALGGTMSVSSPPGRGTVLQAELPCA